MKKIYVLLIVLLFTLSCSKEDSKPPLSIKNNELVLFRENTEELIVEHNPGELSFKSQNPLIATVSDDGVVEGNVRGKTSILVTSLNETATANVEVKTLINYLPEPYLGFGEDYATVKTKVVSGEQFFNLENGFAVQKRIDNSNVIYGYSFENSKLKMSMFLFETLSNITSVIADFLLERYIPVAQTGAFSAGLISPEKDMIVLVSASDDNSYVYVAYTEYNGEESSTANATKLLNIDPILSNEKIQKNERTGISIKPETQIAKVLNDLKEDKSSSIPYQDVR